MMGQACGLCHDEDAVWRFDTLSVFIGRDQGQPERASKIESGEGGMNVRVWVNLPVGNGLNLGFYTCRWAFDTGS